MDKLIEKFKNIYLLIYMYNQIIIYNWEERVVDTKDRLPTERMINEWYCFLNDKTIVNLLVRLMLYPNKGLLPEGDLEPKPCCFIYSECQAEISNFLKGKN